MSRYEPPGTGFTNHASHAGDDVGVLNADCTDCRKMALNSGWTVEYRTIELAGVPLTESRWISDWRPVTNYVKPTDPAAPRIDRVDG